MTTPSYDTDFYQWTQEQAAALRAQDWAALDLAHLAEEIEGLCHSARHHLTMLALGFLELIYRPCGHEEGQYYWQSAVIDHERAMLASSLEESPRLRPILERQLPEAYTWARARHASADPAAERAAGVLSLVPDRAARRALVAERGPGTAAVS
jgi:hypothetical protein